jgi:hypothetical protein
MTIVNYLDKEHNFFAQYCRRSAGFYPGLCRRARRAAEIAAHAAAVRQAETFERQGSWVVAAYRNNAHARLAGPKGHLPAVACLISTL